MGICSISEIKPETVKRSPSGFSELDWLYGYSKTPTGIYWGIPYGKISLWAGESGVGKSRAAISVAKKLVNIGARVLYFQNEVDLPTFADWVKCNYNNFIVSDDTDLKKAITDLLKDPQFQAKVSEIRKTSNLKFFKTDSFAKLSTFLTETNFEKIIIQLPNGQFRLRLAIDYNPHFKTSSTLQLSDFPTGKVYTLDMTELSKLRQISSDAEMMSLLNEDIGDGLVAGYHPSYPDAIVLIPSNKLDELKNTFIQIGYKYQGVTYYSFVCDSDGNRLISKLNFNDGGITIRQGSSWARNFYEYNPSFENGAMIGFESNFYAAYTFATGDDVKAVLQDTTVILEHMDPFKDTLHNSISGDPRARIERKIREYKTPTFKDSSKLTLDLKNELIEVLSFIDQYVHTRSFDQKYQKYAFSDLIISRNFYDKDISIIKSLLNDLNPTLNQLSDLSYSKQKLFYSTIHELLKGYSGTDTIINDYKNKVEEILNDPDPDKNNKFQNILSTTYTENEFEAVKLMEDILPNLFGYRFTAMLKMGAISLFRENGEVNFQPLALVGRRLVQDMLNRKRVKAISAISDDVYGYNGMAKQYGSIITCYIIFGHQTTFDVINKGSQTLYMHAADYNSFLSGLVNGDFNRPTNPISKHYDYGILVNIFLKIYGSLPSPKLTIRKNIDGKTALMNGFGNLFQARISPTIIQNIGVQSGLTILQNNAEVISKSSINYATLYTFQKLISPSRRRDPTGTFRSIFRETSQSGILKIDPSSQRLSWSPLWIGASNRAQNLGLLNLNYATIAYYFGKDFSTIQPALFYTEVSLQSPNIIQPLSVQELLTSEFKDKINHLNNKFYESISTKYSDGDKLTATFHQDTSNGIYYNNDEDNSLLSNVIPIAIQDKFPDLFSDNANSLSITIQKEGNEILNEDELNIFIDSLTFYLVMFNSIALIQEGNGQIGMVASQRELFNMDYIFQLDGFELSPIGQQILAEHQASWNRDNQNNIVWNYGDCWPISLFPDARELINLMNWQITNFKYEPWEMNIIYPS